MLWGRHVALVRRDAAICPVSGAKRKCEPHPRTVRGRYPSYLAPPAQIRTSPIRAYGSHLGCVTARRDIFTSYRMCFSACDTVPRYCARPVRCWLTFPSAPALGSTDSAAGCPALFVSFTATMAGSDFSQSCIIGYGSSLSRHGPAQHACCRWSIVRSPGSRTKSVHTCQVLRPRRAGRALALACSSVLPSATLKASAPEMRSLSRLNSLACALPCQRFTTALASDRA